ncbi:MAG: XrtA/PEP-CTERM system TPR-repeat protein PrsT, partial [Betaproteobacteria bacterium]
MKRSSFLFGQCVLLMALLVGACSDKGSDALLISAKGYLEKNELKAATIQLKNLLQDNPESAEARFLLGKTLFKQGDLAGAEIELKRALELKHPRSAVAPVMAGVLMAGQEFRKLTDQYAGLVLDDKPAEAEVQTLVALAFAVQEQPDKARAAIVKALELAPQSPQVLLANARIKASASDTDGALAALDEMLARAPTDFDAWQLKGNLLLQLKKDAKGAIEAYKQALAIRPDNVQLHATLISLYITQRDQTAATQQFDALKKAQPEDPLTKFYEAQIAFSRGDFARTRQLVKALLIGAPTNAALLHLAGAVELKLDAVAQAETYLTQAVELQPQFAAARSLLAQVYLRTDRPARAMFVLRPMLLRPAVDADTLMLAGRAQLLANDAKGADELFRRAAAMRPSDNSARTALAILQLSKGNADAAFSELQSIAAAEQGVNVDLALISAHMKRGEFDAAARAIDVLEKKQPT